MLDKDEYYEDDASDDCDADYTVDAHHASDDAFNNDEHCNLEECNSADHDDESI